MCISYPKCVFLIPSTWNLYLFISIAISAHCPVWYMLRTSHGTVQRVDVFGEEAVGTKESLRLCPLPFIDSVGAEAPSSFKIWVDYEFLRVSVTILFTQWGVSSLPTGCLPDSRTFLPLVASYDTQIHGRCILCCPLTDVVFYEVFKSLQWPACLRFPW